jgi:hypothetical protein
VIGKALEAAKHEVDDALPLLGFDGVNKRVESGASVVVFGASVQNSAHFGHCNQRTKHSFFAPYNAITVFKGVNKAGKGEPIVKRGSVVQSAEGSVGFGSHVVGNLAANLRLLVVAENVKATCLDCAQEGGHQAVAVSRNHAEAHAASCSELAHLVIVEAKAGCVALVHIAAQAESALELVVFRSVLVSALKRFLLLQQKTQMDAMFKIVALLAARRR